MCFFLSHLTRCMFEYEKKKKNVSRDINPYETMLTSLLVKCFCFHEWWVFASSISVNTRPCTDLEWIGNLCNLFYLKEIVRFKDLCSCQCDSAVHADMFHPLTLINLLTELFREKKGEEENMVGKCEKLLQHWLGSFYFFCKSPSSADI